MGSNYDHVFVSQDVHLGMLVRVADSGFPVVGAPTYRNEGGTEDNPKFCQHFSKNTTRIKEVLVQGLHARNRSV